MMVSSLPMLVVLVVLTRMLIARKIGLRMLILSAVFQQTPSSDPSVLRKGQELMEL